MKHLRFLVLALTGLVTLSVIMTEKVNAAASLYGLSCTNKAYGTQLSDSSDAFNLYLDAYLISPNQSDGVAYVGNNCIYSGAGKTNSAAIVSGDVARVAVNAIVGGINSRITQAMSQNDDMGAHMAFRNDGSGLGISANKIFGGISLWANASSTDFDNDQTYTSGAYDSNAYDADASSQSFGLDKRIGNFLIGVTYNSFDTDITTTVNTGSYDADGSTLGAYVALNTGILSLSAGMGTGDYDFNTSRLDLGTGNTQITGSGSADVEYTHLQVSAKLNRGRISLTPRLSYKSIDLDTPAFTEIVPNDANTAGGDDANTATNNDGTGKNTENISVVAHSATSETVEAGFTIGTTIGILMPYLDVAYQSEDTTKAAYLTELGTDGVIDTAASDPDSSYTIGAGVIFGIGSHLTGGISYTGVYDREDYNGSTVMGTIKLNF